jgi:hypothetical protein
MTATLARAVNGVGFLLKGRRSTAEAAVWRRPIYTSVRMLKTWSKTCHFVPLFAVRGGYRGRKLCAVCQTGTGGSELV